LDFFSLVREFGAPVGMAALAVYAFVAGKIVARWTYDELRADRDAWRRTAEEATEALAHSNRIASEAVQKVVSQ
jgi:hypothetical protein